LPRVEELALFFRSHKDYNKRNQDRSVFWTCDCMPGTAQCQPNSPNPVTEGVSFLAFIRCPCFISAWVFFGVLAFRSEPLAARMGPTPRRPRCKPAPPFPGFMFIHHHAYRESTSNDHFDQPKSNRSSARCIPLRTALIQHYGFDWHEIQIAARRFGMRCSLAGLPTITQAISSKLFRKRARLSSARQS